MTNDTIFVCVRSTESRLRTETHRGKEEGDVLVDVSLLRKFKIFDELNDRELEQIVKAGKLEDLGPGATLTQAGAPANRLYLIVDGKVTVNVEGPQGKTIGADTLGPGQVLGWSALVGPYIYTASGVTEEKTTVVVFSGSKLREIFEINNHIGYRVLKGMGAVISRRITALENKAVQ